MTVNPARREAPESPVLRPPPGIVLREPSRGASDAPPGPPQQTKEEADLAELVSALRLLRGSNANLAQCVAMGLLSLFCCLSSVSVVVSSGGGAGMGAPGIGFYLLAILLLSTGVLQAAKTVRDQRMASVFPDELLSSQLVGTAASRWMNAIAVAASFALAAALVAVMGVSTSSPAEGSSFLLISIAFLLTSLVNLSKAWRDRFDAVFFEAAVQRFPRRAADFSRAVHMLELTSGVFYTINGISALVSTAAIIAAIALSPLEQTLKTLLILAVIFMIASAVNASKLVRDEMEAGIIKPTLQWKAITILAVLLSLGFVLGVDGSACQQSSGSLCALLYVGTFWVLGAGRPATPGTEKDSAAILTLLQVMAGVGRARMNLPAPLRLRRTRTTSSQPTKPSPPCAPLRRLPPRSANRLAGSVITLSKITRDRDEKMRAMQGAIIGGAFLGSDSTLAVPVRTHEKRRG